MLEKFEKISDEIIVKLIKNGDSDAELELFHRYKRNATTLGRNIYNQFKSSLNCDVEDLINSALLAVFIAAKSYDGEKGFEGYWYTVAKHEVMDVVKNNSDSFKSKNQFKFISFAEHEDEIMVVADSGQPKTNILYQEIINKINNPSFKADELSKVIFKLYLDGFSYEEIAKMHNLKEYSVRYKIKKVKEKLVNFILPSF